MRKIINALVFCFVMVTSTMSYGAWHFYGPTFENEHLYRIALRVRPTPHVSVQQMMVALLYANPSAFNQHNINGLKSGYHLRLPSFDAVVRINPQYAVNFVNHQNSEWVGNHLKKSRTVTKIAKHVASKNAPKVKITDAIPQIDSANSESKLTKTTSEEATSSLIDIANGQHALKATEQESASATTTQQPQTATTNENVTDKAAIEKMDNFMTETKKFEQDINTQIASLQQQNKVLQTTVNQVNKDLQALTYQFIQLTAKTNSNRLNPTTKVLLDGLKKNAIGLSAAVLALILLTYLLKRTFRSRPVSTSRKDEYDYMGSKESIPSKLDLASAYIDMGDYSAAETALKEVLAQGNEEQKKTARDLLGKMNQR